MLGAGRGRVLSVRGGACGDAIPFRMTGVPLQSHYLCFCEFLETFDKRGVRSGEFLDI